MAKIMSFGKIDTKKEIKVTKTIELYNRTKKESFEYDLVLTKSKLMKASNDMRKKMNIYSTKDMELVKEDNIAVMSQVEILVSSIVNDNDLAYKILSEIAEPEELEGLHNLLREMMEELTELIKDTKK